MRQHQRSKLEAYLTGRTSMTAVEAGALSDEQVCEHVLAFSGVACVSIEVAAEIERIEALGYNVPLARLDAAVFSIFSGVLAEYRKPRVLV